ncbi:hypothetical protein CERSUDRAFT_114652 [Gelatoporia subvermispora B]|uniref:Uncharacterized protein n=1 Tax=Ceriporiopsis subvermispora (strain B) TaxID=914234 RepID=M2QI78_CERS8|nr:hypothetical protein CERSUDRAFT_114652 [Gelatoporia subvermispora B]
MTWIFGWPLELERAIEYAQEQKLDRSGTRMDETQLYLAAAMHIMQKLYLYDWPLKACWDGKRMKSVFALCIDKKARTAEEAKIRMSRMPPYETALKLAGVLQAEDEPKWYRYDDGTYTPWRGELYPPADSDESDGPRCAESNSRGYSQWRGWIRT